MTAITQSLNNTVGTPSPRRHAPTRSRGLLYGTSIVAGLAIWQWIAQGYDSFILASPTGVAARLVDLTASGVLPKALLNASGHMLLGFGISIAIALPLGFLMGRIRALHDLLDPLVNLLYAVPAIAWAPVIMIWFGLFFEARVALVVLMCTLDMLIVVSEGARNVDRRLLSVGRAFGAGPWQNARMVLWPASLPFVFAALRVGVVRAVNAMVTAELFLAAVNLGAIMKQASVRLDSAAVLGVLFVMSVLGLVLQELLLLLERRVCRWAPKA
jgi:NitT/TauT family transport system permease protein